ncbi:hypothetical protein PsorP6_006308 [Peronosclerospora sorghi]|uniref:Uncharacterized protein n=1 Tax=Peronosclerospora sorghi TaxID=230839 RepID=A0ACC0W5C1_9STRA|nr:hypothetical protein PsorP6_006308 [Peronosclerospora sorghi]
MMAPAGSGAGDDHNDTARPRCPPPPPPPEKKRCKALERFQAHHELEYGLSISNLHPKTKEVEGVVCRFCQTFGREEKDGELRKRTANSKYFNAPFLQHPQRWQSYANLSAEDTKTYFDGIVPFKASLHAHFGQSETAIHFRIRRIIVDVVIGEMLFHPADVCDETKERALRTFTKGDQQVVVGGRNGIISTKSEYKTSNSSTWQSASLGIERPSDRLLHLSSLPMGRLGWLPLVALIGLRLRSTPE